MRKQRKELGYKYKFLIGIAVGLITSMVSGIVISSIFSIIDLSIDYSNSVGLMLSAVYAYTSAYIFGKLNQNDGMKCGFLIFSASLILMLILSLITKRFELVLIKSIIIFITSQIGGIIGVNSKIKNY